MAIEKSYQISDINICAFLLTHPEINLLEVLEENPRRYLFVLSNPSLCINLRRDYINGATAVARDLFAKRELLISQIKERNRF